MFSRVPPLLVILIASSLSFPALAEDNCVTLADQVEQRGRVTLDGVHFDFDRALLRPDSIPILLQARDLILASSGTWVIEGHTDNVGALDYNQRLSQERADAVVGWLVDNGVESSRLRGRGYGPDQPVADNASETGRALNRRVELVAADREAEFASLARQEALCARISEPEELSGEASISGPASAVAGSTIEVEWEGPNHANDYITVVEPDARDGQYRGWSSTRNGSPARFTAPDRPGDYELRYVLGASVRTLARQAIQITPADAGLTGPEQIGAGSTFEVAWTGPDNQRDFITIVAAGAPDRGYLSYQYSSNGNPASLQAPDQPGLYELRYVTGQTNHVLARWPIQVADVSATVTGPEQVGAGSAFEVAWTGPDNQRDFITIVAAGAPDRGYLSYQYSSSGNPASLQAPDQPGLYELRYVTGQANQVLVRQAIQVVDVSATITGPEQIGAGSTFEVAWTGPDNQRDFITIVVAGAPDQGYLSYQYSSGGNPAFLQAPDQAGPYELRYVTGQANQVLVRQAIQVVDVSATITGPEQIGAGSTFEVAWTGPDNQRDFITIVAVGAPDQGYLSYQYSSSGNPASLQAPDQPGLYELRYVSAQNTVLARQAVTVVAEAP